MPVEQRVLDTSREPYVSTGHLPPSARTAGVVKETHARFAGNRDGTVSTVYPALARVPSDLFGVCVASTTGSAYEAGDSRVEFSIMSVAKPFVFALVCDALGADALRRMVGVNATGYPFNSLAAVERGGGKTNPMVNSGAIATTSLAPGGSVEARWSFLHEGLSKFAGRDLPFGDEVYRSAAETNHQNRSIARLLHALDAVYIDPDEATDLYTRQSSVLVTAEDLAWMGATLADGGVHPVTRVRVVGADACRHALSVMAVAGLYETSGDWLYEVGLPGKSGIGGGIVAVSPGKGGLGTFAPRLDEHGNSVKGELAARELARELGLDIFVSPVSVPRS